MSISSITPSKSSGETIRELREAKGMSLADLALETGISRTYIWRIETSNHVPGYEIATRIAQTLGTRAAKIWPRLGDESEVRIEKEVAAENEPVVDHLYVIVRLWLKTQALTAQSTNYWPDMLSPRDEERLKREFLGQSLAVLGQIGSAQAPSREANEVAISLVNAAQSEADRNIPGAIKAFRDAKILTSDPDIVAHIDWNLGRCYEETCDFGAAIDSLDQALKRFQISRIAPADMAGIQSRLGWLNYRAAKYEVAKTCFYEARAIWSSVPTTDDVRPHEGLLQAERGLASVLERQGYLREAEDLFAKALHQAEEDNDELELAWITARNGFLQIHTCDWALAEDEMGRALTNAEDLVSKARSLLPKEHQMVRWLETLRQMIWNNRGLLQFRQRKYADAITSCTNGLQIAQDLHDSRGEAFCHLFVANSYAALGQWDEAKQHARTAELSFRRMYVLHYLPETLVLQAEIDLETTGAKGVKPLLEEALEQARNTESVLQQGFVHRVYGIAHMREGDLPRARQELTESLELLTAIDEPYERILSHFAFAKILLELNESDLARQQLRDADRLASQHRMNSLVERCQQLQETLDDQFAGHSG